MHAQKEELLQRYFPPMRLRGQSVSAAVYAGGFRYRGAEMSVQARPERGVTSVSTFLPRRQATDRLQYCHGAWR